MSTRRPSIADLARTLRLSPSTISRALSGAAVSEATRQRVRQLAQELRYQPNPAAVALRRGYSNTLGILLPSLTDSVFPEVLAGVLEVAGPAGFHVLIGLTQADTQQEQRHLELLAKAKVAGVLLSPASSSPNCAHLEAARAADLPLVFFDQAVENFAGRRVGAVLADDYAGAYAAVAHLLAEGCRQVAHLAGPPHLAAYQCRHQGYHQALRDHHLPYREELCHATEPSQAAGAAAMRQLLRLPARPDAVFAATDALAAGALLHLRERGLRVPQDVALVGFGNAGFTALTEPPLTTVDQRSRELGGLAARQLLQLLQPGAGPAPPAPVLVRPQLLVRASSQRQSPGTASLD